MMMTENTHTNTKPTTKTKTTKCEVAAETLFYVYIIMQTIGRLMWLLGQVIFDKSPKTHKEKIYIFPCAATSGVVQTYCVCAS